MATIRVRAVRCREKARADKNINIAHESSVAANAPDDDDFAQSARRRANDVAEEPRRRRIWNLTRVRIKRSAVQQSKVVLSAPGSAAPGRVKRHSSRKTDYEAAKSVTGFGRAEIALCSTRLVAVDALPPPKCRFRAESNSRFGRIAPIVYA
jgi:hypothetical protein